MKNEQLRERLRDRKWKKIQKIDESVRVDIPEMRFSILGLNWKELLLPYNKKKGRKSNWAVAKDRKVPVGTEV